MEINNQNQDFGKVIEALLDNSRPFPPRYLHSFSDISLENMDLLKKIWNQVEPRRRSTLVADLEPILEADTLLNFDEFTRFALNDEEGEVREHAIHLLWECEDAHLIPILMHMLQHDPSELVRAAAASGLGKFVYLGEIDEIPAGMLKELEDVLIGTFQNANDPEIQRKTLESLGYSSRPEVRGYIQKAFLEKDARWLASALFAMGRSADRQWENQVSEMIDHHDEEVRVEAIRAAGELELISLRDALIQSATDTEEIWEVRMAAFWSLSQLGGEEARDTLEDLLEDAEDDEEADILEEALDNLSFTDDQHTFGINL
jgi:HEAT repeat protein